MRWIFEGVLGENSRLVCTFEFGDFETLGREFYKILWKVLEVGEWGFIILFVIFSAVYDFLNLKLDFSYATLSIKKRIFSEFVEIWFFFGFWVILETSVGNLKIDPKQL